MKRRLLTHLLSLAALAACHTGNTHIATIPGNPLKDVNTPLDVADASVPSEKQDGGKQLLGFEATPHRASGNDDTKATKDYYTDGPKVFDGKVPGTEIRFPTYYVFRVTSGHLQVDYLGNRFDEAADQSYNDDGSDEVEVIGFHDSHHLSRSISRLNDCVVVDVTVGSPPKRKLYRLQIGDIERCLNNPCK